MALEKEVILDVNIRSQNDNFNKLLVFIKNLGNKGNYDIK